MAKSFAMTLGVILLVVGVWGMLTGGHAHKLVVFGINASHNRVRLVSGILALIAAMAGVSTARLYLTVFGIVYGLVAILGFMNLAAVVQMLNLNAADNYLHPIIAAGYLWAASRGGAASPAAPAAPPK